MKKILLGLFFLGFATAAQAGWFGPANTNEVAFSSNTVDASSYTAVEKSDTPCQTWQIWEKTGTVDIIITTDGTPTSEYPKGNTNVAVSEKIIWAGTVYSSRMNKRKVWVKGNSGTATVLYSAESE
jgi:hypothetical protein